MADVVVSENARALELWAKGGDVVPETPARDGAREVIEECRRLRSLIEAHALAGWEYSVQHDLHPTWKALADAVGMGTPCSECDHRATTERRGIPYCDDCDAMTEAAQ